MRRKYFIKFILGMLWIVAIGTGLTLLWRYAATEGEAAIAPMHWPLTNKTLVAKDRATLIITLHPRCPCSRASLGELAKIMAEAQGLVETRVLFIRPPGVSVDWEKTDLWQQASRIPNVRVLSDEAGEEAQRFGAKTSGQVMLYDKQGRLFFSGGITRGRGHAGDNEGRAAIVAILRGKSPDKLRTPVYGCSLLAAQDGCVDQSDCSTDHFHLNSQSTTPNEFTS
jgi:hypothetical protein